MPAPTSRGAKAAARVAARYANAPSYSEMLAREARAAVDAAKAAAKAAEEAQAAFQYVLEGLEAAGPAAPEWEFEARPERSLERRDAQPVTARLLVAEPPATQPEPAVQDCSDEEQSFAAFFDTAPGAQRNEIAAHDVVRRCNLAGTEANAGKIEEAVQPIYANLIEFPRPMVAARKARPRRAEGPLAELDSAPQLSIFEVDPAAISVAPPAVVDPSAPPSWMRTEWPALNPDEGLPAQSPEAMHTATSMAATTPMNLAVQPHLATQPWEEFADSRLDEFGPQSASLLRVELAPLSRRALAIVVDCTFTAAWLVLAAFAAAPHVRQLPGGRAMACGAALAFLAAGFAYHACFLTLFRSTPGMRYAGIEIDTVSGSAPVRTRRWRRLMAMLLSVLPLGLGFVWAIFDDDHLAWHDRLSGTYLRRR